MTIGYSTDKPETTLQDVANAFGCNLQGYTVLLSGDVTGLTPKQVAAQIERFMKAAMIDQGVDVSTFIINQDKERIMAFIDKQADLYQVNLLKIADAQELKKHRIDAVLGIGKLNDKLVAWAESKGMGVCR